MPQINKGEAHILYVALLPQVGGASVQTNPTLATGDFKLSQNGGAFSNLAALPVVTPAGGAAVKISLSAVEMNADSVSILGSDAAGSEWNDIFIHILTYASGSSSISVTGGKLLRLGKLNRLSVL